jgi:hypothetical protein
MTMTEMFQNWANKMPPRTRDQLLGSATVTSAGEPENDSDYQTYLDGLSPAAQAAIADLDDDDEYDAWPEERKPAFCIVVCPDGEIPQLHTCHSAEEVAERMKALLDDDAYAFPFLGIPLPFTEAPSRVLFLPDDTAVPINAEGRAAIDAAEDHAEDIILQDDFYVGPPELKLITARTEVVEEPEEDAPEDTPPEESSDN